MSIWSSLFTASSGISAYGNAMSVVGDNVANVGTTGFKGSRAGFAAILGGIGANQQRVGAGVQMTGAQIGMGQGSLQQTGRSMDMAVWGKGWFNVQGSHKGVEGDYFTRDGRFDWDNQGVLRNSSNLRLQGYQYDAASDSYSSSLTDIQSQRTVPPLPTSEMKMQMFLPPDGGTGTEPLSRTMNVYDQSGQPHEVEVTFVYVGPPGAANEEWTWTAEVDGGETTTGVPGSPQNIGGGSLFFDPTTNTFNNSSPDTINAFFNGNASSQIIDLDFTGSNQYSSQFDARLEQDGYASGTVQDYTINEDGIIEAVYSNREKLTVGRVALALFEGEAHLERMGSQLFRGTPESGLAAISMAGETGRGSIQSGVIEGSNVDLGTELVTMITYQRAFQANARAVTTADEMLAETANLKR